MCSQISPHWACSPWGKGTGISLLRAGKGQSVATKQVAFVVGFCSQRFLRVPARSESFLALTGGRQNSSCLPTRVHALPAECSVRCSFPVLSSHPTTPASSLALPRPQAPRESASTISTVQEQGYAQPRPSSATRRDVEGQENAALPVPYRACPVSLLGLGKLLANISWKSKRPGVFQLPLYNGKFFFLIKSQRAYCMSLTTSLYRLDVVYTKLTVQVFTKTGAFLIILANS